MDKPALELKFDPNTIEHLGVSLYSQLPSVLSELISNAWDADAKSVLIDFIDKGSQKEIHFQDDGEGMSFEELNDQYLVIGRNRRSEKGKETSTSGRPVIGKKGLGKLAVFGICNIIEVRSIKRGLENHFLMNIEDIKAEKSKSYSPQIISYENPTQNPDGTEIILKEVRRKSAFDLEKIGISISKKFTILDRMQLDISFNSAALQTVTNELKYDGVNKQFSWVFPDKKYDDSYEYWEQIGGEIITLDKPVKDTEMRGIYLTSRGKIVNTSSFYGARDNDQFHNYVTGYLEVDFIDELDTDVISTDRHSLNWESDHTRELQLYLQKIIRKIGQEWKLNRANLKKTTIEKENDLKISEWQDTLPTYEKQLSSKIIDPILSNSDIDSTDATSIITGVMEKFDNKVFKDYASHIADISTEQELPKFLKLMTDWEAIESKQFKDLAFARIEVIKQFEKYVNQDTHEVPTLHNFLKRFSWLLDPRILEFKDEVTYSQLLKENFPEEALEEPNKRIDFLCTNALGEILYVIEIKRSNYVVDEKALEQAYKYRSFLEHKYKSATGFSKIVVYVVGGSKSSHYIFQDKEKTFSGTGQVFVKTYRELLEQSKEYHKEFLSAYDELS